MADTFTGNLNLTKPEIGGSRDAWGLKWNDNADKIDAAVAAVLAAVAAIPPGVPPGTIAYFARPDPPNGWLRCIGYTLQRASYPALFNAIGTIYGAPDGNTFQIPDARGLFLRSLDEGRGVDPGRGYNSVQGSQNLAHTHGPGANSLFITNGNGAYVASGEYLGLAGSTSSSGGNEARPINIAFPVYIKY